MEGHRAQNREANAVLTSAVAELGWSVSNLTTSEVLLAHEVFRIATEQLRGAVGALRKYAAHQHGCPARDGRVDAARLCTCGLHAALDQHGER